MADAAPLDANPVPQDLGAARPTAFSWVDNQRLNALETLRETVAEKIDGAAGWYMRGKMWRRKFGRFVRVAAMILATLAAAQPTVAEMNRHLDYWWFRPGTATIFALIAAALLLLDRFFGASTGWVRYIMTGMSLNDLRDEFEGAWRLECAAWAGQMEPTIEQTRHAVSLLHSFITRVNEIVRAETEAWKAEFQNALQQIEEYAKAAPRKIEESGLKVTVLNFDKLENGWTISLNGAAPERVTAPEKTYILTPGQVRIIAEGTLADGKKSVKREELANVKPGDIAGVSITLA